MKSFLRTACNLACSMAAVAALAACGNNTTPPPAENAAKPAATIAATPAPAVSLGDVHATKAPAMAAVPLNETNNAAGLNSSLPAEAPANFTIQFETSKGVVVASFHKDWAPLGVQRIYDLARANYFNDVRFFRVVPNFVVQFGISGDPAQNTEWRTKTLLDDPVKHSNTRGTITFAKTNQPNTRSTQFFINLNDNTSLDATGFAPIGEVLSGMDVVAQFYKDYGDATTGDQQNMEEKGNAYVTKQYPNLDFIKKTLIAR